MQFRFIRLQKKPAGVGAATGFFDLGDRVLGLIALAPLFHALKGYQHSTALRMRSLV